MYTLGPANFGIILLLYRGCSLSEVKLYCHVPVETTELVLYREVKHTYCVLNSEGPLREVPLYKDIRMPNHCILSMYLADMSTIKVDDN